MNAAVQLLDPSGNPLPIDSVTVTETVNEGWTWSATLPKMPRYAEDSPLIDAFPGEGFRFHLTISSNGQSLALPPLVATDYEEDVTGGGTVGGVDEATYLLTRRRAALTGSGITTSSELLESIASSISITGGLVDYEAWAFDIQEVEQSGTTAMLPHIVRICDVACQEWRAQLGTGGTCDIRFSSLDINAEPDAWQPDWSRVVRRRDMSSRIASMTLVKSGRMSDAVSFNAHMPVGYVYTLGSPWVVVQSPYSGIYLGGLYGECGSGGVFAGKRGSGDLVYWMRFEESNPEPFTVRGRSYASTIDDPFSTTISVDGAQGNKADETWEEDWLPGASYAQSRKDTYLWRANRATHTIEWEGPLCPGLHLGQVLTWPGQPNSRVESYTHSIGGRSVSTHVTSAVLAAGQW